jgi:predicted small lipoprotein YifL
MATRSRSVVSTAAQGWLLLAALSCALVVGCGQKGPLVAAKTVAPPASAPASALRPLDAPGAMLPASSPR